MKLKGKTVVITGAASGMGRAQARLFSKEGANVIAADIDKDSLDKVVKEITSNGGQALAVQADISNRDSVKDLVKKGVEEYSSIDILCNTAGILDDYSPSLDTSEDLWDRIFNVNLKGMFLLTNEVLPHMIKKEKGVIINISSIAGFVAGGGGAAYTSAKHAVVGYTKQLSFDYGKQGIRVNAIAPGAIKTGMTEEILKDEDAPVMETIKSVPAGRYGQPEEIANLALFLASEESDFIHGAIVPIDGGWLVK
ncbi:3-oxoacyl-ACP reductase [Serpentinicella sp. ANB-PHB4]|uniref:3-oxoacyl-ACP reductase n=1 Tax=Serpentinicella sp. ANB-PHB4 TaxID=3074076 RepID=UPI0028635090|nr:3-oxoacyl-ACP reductase [Serpentinicella sp. ANB-PHB4]MDR5658563.1 3-oxoacyl-ACP reductase [Serpentinicella sp. ANB-PHB4]